MASYTHKVYIWVALLALVLSLVSGEGNAILTCIGLLVLKLRTCSNTQMFNVFNNKVSTFAARLLMSVSERCIQISQQKHIKFVVILVSIIDDNCCILQACEVW